MASLVGKAVVALHSEAPGSELGPVLDTGMTLSFAVHQATGMVAVQGSMNTADALAVLRSYAFGSSLALSTVARQVVSREIFFHGDSMTWRNVKGPVSE